MYDMSEIWFKDTNYLKVPYYTHENNGADGKDVIRSLIDTAKYLEAMPDFEEWCWTFGYNDDSIKALRTYEKELENNKNFKALFNDAEWTEIFSLDTD